MQHISKIILFFILILYLIIIFVPKISRNEFDLNNYQTLIQAGVPIYSNIFNINRTIIIHRKGEHTPSLERDISAVILESNEN